MRVFNRIVMILLFAGLFVLGVYMVVYSLNLFGYRLEDIPRLWASPASTAASRPSPKTSRTAAFRCSL